MSLFGCPAVIPEWPFAQSYEMEYAKKLPLRLKDVALMGPGAASKAFGKGNDVRDVGVKGEYSYFLGGCEHPCPRSGWYRLSLKKMEY